MKRYFLRDRGVVYAFGSNAERAEKEAVKLGVKVEVENVWRYYAPFYTCGTGNYREIKGTSIVAAIESNFNLIVKDCGLGGVAGYKLKSVALKANGNCADLIINIARLGRLGRELPPFEKIIKIEWLEDGELPEAVYNFERK